MPEYCIFNIQVRQNYDKYSYNFRFFIGYKFCNSGTNRHTVPNKAIHATINLKKK